MKTMLFLAMMATLDVYDVVSVEDGSMPPPLVEECAPVVVHDLPWLPYWQSDGSYAFDLPTNGAYTLAIDHRDFFDTGPAGFWPCLRWDDCLAMCHHIARNYQNIQHIRADVVAGECRCSWTTFSGAHGVTTIRCRKVPVRER